MERPPQGVLLCAVVVLAVLGGCIPQAESCGDSPTWEKLGTSFTSVSVGLAGVWGTGDKAVYYRHGTSGEPAKVGSNDWKKWTKEELRMVDVGNYSVWGVTQDYKLVCRWGVDADTPLGYRWEDGPSDLMRHVSISPKGFLVGVTKDGKFAYRTGGFSNSCSKDWSWTVEDGADSVDLKMVSAGSSGVWAIGTNYELYHRYNTRWDGNVGESWTQVDNSEEYKYVSVGYNVVMAVRRNNQVWRREGVTWQAPTGTSWLRMTGRLLKSVDIYHDGCYVWGVTTHGEVYRGQYD